MRKHVVYNESVQFHKKLYSRTVAMEIYRCFPKAAEEETKIVKANSQNYSKTMDKVLKKKKSKRKRQPRRIEEIVSEFPFHKRNKIIFVLRFVTMMKTNLSKLFLAGSYRSERVRFMNAQKAKGGTKKQ